MLLYSRLSQTLFRWTILKRIQVDGMHYLSSLKSTPLMWRAKRTWCSGVALPDLSSNHRNVMALDKDRIRPIHANNAFVAPSASVIGAVDLAEKVVVWYGSVLRADFAEIVVSGFSVIEDNCVLTVVPPKRSGELKPINIGSWVVIESHSILQSCTIDSRTRIGAHSVIEPGAHIDMDCVILPHSVVSANQSIPTGEVWGGNPAKFIRKVDPDQVEDTIQQAENMFYFTKQHIVEFFPKGFAYIEKERLQTRLE
ncbi:Gamma carbonic anhydrase 2, mitochondrial [Galdieria sulphuraria]|uniref:Uncharacterized protein n=1 Tax=Galdieria sulphuraria TaxID=130081 RepID=M2VW39_GALSU|nr:uncharacterized protein Gasu_50380 [Galdieria sulphuraria]EME27446.1 hypothetical protein Gasu_50380 [Galdieria sulphuraria]GJD09283.1 Gamma carbonic anhydrase 2, mitochondrial [Galdieria sulphuraria]|eukprot:XP_005703966.1 hypothetical protein Gasu_50380 [Galdieria sulphuraria]